MLKVVRVKIEALLLECLHIIRSNEPNVQLVRLTTRENISKELVGLRVEGTKELWPRRQPDTYQASLLFIGNASIENLAVVNPPLARIVSYTKDFEDRHRLIVPTTIT